MTAGFRPVDHEARERARHDHATSLVLEAGAGTGKTTLLVDRIEQLIRSGHARLEEIAAVTFTENAATTLKLRLRERLERARADRGTAEAERTRCGAALEMLERAQVSTIHALCAAILQERPLECGVVPGFRTADEAEADLMFSEAWEDWLYERLEGGDEVLLEALDQQIPLEGIGPWGERSSLRGLARTMVDERDLRPLVAPAELDTTAFRDELLRKAARARELVTGLPDADVLVARLQSLAAFAEKSRFLQGRALHTHLADVPTIQRNVGFRPRWPSDEALQEARGIAAFTHEWKERFAASRSAALHSRLVGALQDVVRIYERKKTARGVLDFIDLLVKARDALRDRESVRRHFHERFKTLIIDEFQDTDPLQVEVASLLAGDTPGRLVVVGDAKQSIYRFRRAEVALFKRTAEAARSRPGYAVLSLTQNFRSRPAILRFVNRVFTGLIQASDEAGQPAYEPIAPPPGLSEEPSVVALRFGEDYASGGDLLQQEAKALAAFFARVAAGGETVRDLATGEDRPSRAGDIMLLVRRLTHVRLLEEAFEAAGLRFSVEGGKSFFDRQEVNEVLALLKAVEDPTDRVSLVAALRSAFLGVSDRDIVAFALSGGQLRIQAPPREEPEPDPEAPWNANVPRALRVLERLHQDRTRLSVPALLDWLFDETRVLAALTGSRRGEGAIANLRKVLTLARSASDLGVLTLRGFTRLLEERTQSAREEPDLPVSRAGDPDTLRILSVHKAKGLEAAVVACFDSIDNFNPGSSVIPLFDEGTVAIGFRRGCQPPQWDALVKREEKRAWAEARRLLYVAATRARDLLVLPQPPGSAEHGSFWKELWQALPPKGDADVRVVDASSLPSPEKDASRTSLRLVEELAETDAVAVRWETERRALLEEASYRAYLPTKATALHETAAPMFGSAPGAGRDFGAFVHKLLEWIPFAGLGREEIARMARALAPTFRLSEREADRAVEHVSRVLEMPLLARARQSRRVFREIPLFFPEEGRLVEGVVDLVFEEEDGLVVADYKTEGMAPGEELERAARHAEQLRAYHRGLRDALGLPVKERFVIFTSLGRAVPV